MIWLMAGLALAQTPLRTAAIQAVETFEARELPRPPASTDRRAMLPWVEAMKSLLADHQAAVAAVESLDESDREAGLALLARVSTHLAELASSADRERLTPGRDDLASALDERAAEAWLGVMHHAAEVGVWGAAAEQARLWIIERDPALLEEVALPWSLAWRRAPCSERQLRVSTLTTWRGELARGCRALARTRTGAAHPRPRASHLPRGGTQCEAARCGRSLGARTPSARRWGPSRPWRTVAARVA